MALALAPVLAFALPPPVKGAIRLREASAAWGLQHRHHHGGSGRFYMPETMGAGVAIFDYDADGDPDVFFVDSGALPGYQGEAGRSMLFRNEGAGRFRDVTAEAGLRVTTYGMGATAGDVDGDGDLDLYVSGFGSGQLFRNQGDGSFVEVSDAAGVTRAGWGTSAAFADPDRDGDLDLYVAQYVDFGFDNNPPCGKPEQNLRSYCHPNVFAGLPDHYFRNQGGGRFVPGEAAAGLGGDAGNGLGVVWGDLDHDGWTDLYVANDMTPAFLFHNLGSGRFEELGALSGTALSDLGRPEAGMGVDLGDVDGNGWEDIFVTHLDLETNALYSNQGELLFSEGRYVTRLAEPSLYLVGFGAAFADLDHDADLDLLVANGHIIHNAELFGTGTTYKQRNQAFENTGAGVFREERQAGLEPVRASRGLALGDLDGDGDLDAVVTNSDDLSEAYENVGSAGGWLQVDLAAPVGNTAGIGARVEVEAAGRRQQREVRTASSYLSQSALTLHFGVGEGEIDRLVVRWPGGRSRTLVRPPRDRRLRVVAAAP